MSDLSEAKKAELDRRAKAIMERLIASGDPAAASATWIIVLQDRIRDLVLQVAETGPGPAPGWHKNFMYGPEKK